MPRLSPLLTLLALSPPPAAAASASAQFNSEVGKSIHSALALEMRMPWITVDSIAASLETGGALSRNATTLGKVCSFLCVRAVRGRRRSAGARRLGATPPPPP